MASRAKDWLRQAENDYLWTKDTLENGSKKDFLTRLLFAILMDG